MGDLSAFKTVHPCYSPACSERVNAICDGTFLPAKALGGWVWTEPSLRCISDNTKWNAANEGREINDVHAGEPYVWTCCPFCGGDLPEPLLDAWPIDGESGG